jgi:hypothetical protein
MGCKVQKAITIDRALRRSWSCQHLITIVTRPWDHHRHKTTKINLLTHTKNQNQPTQRKQIYIETQTPRSSKNLCKPATRVCNKEERESSEEDKIMSSQCNWEDAIGSCVEVGGDDEKLAPTYFWNRRDRVDEWDIVLSITVNLEALFYMLWALF